MSWLRRVFYAWVASRKTDRDKGVKVLFAGLVLGFVNGILCALTGKALLIVPSIVFFVVMMYGFALMIIYNERRKLVSR